MNQCDPINPFLAALASVWWISMAGPSRTGRPMRRRRRLKGQVATTADIGTCTKHHLNTGQLGLDHGHQRRETKQMLTAPLSLPTHSTWINRANIFIKQQFSFSLFLSWSSNSGLRHSGSPLPQVLDPANCFVLRSVQSPLQPGRHSALRLQ